VSKKNAIAKIGHDIVSFDGAGLSHLLTVEEVAGLLRCSVSSLNKWRLTGRGPPFVRVGSRVRYRAADLHTYIARRTVNSTSAEVRQLAASPAVFERSRHLISIARALKHFAPTALRRRWFNEERLTKKICRSRAISREVRTMAEVAFFTNN
jgi:excisionase family DNA binding protein